MANNIFSLEVLRARKGDCLLLHYGKKSDPALALIDGGPSQVYKPFLRPRIEELRSERRLTEDQPLPVDLVMLSHIDDDHLVGLLQLTKELVEAKNKPKIIRIRTLWHNTFDDIINNDAKELTDAVSKGFGPAATSGDLPAEVVAELQDSADTQDVVDTVMILASVPQGRELRENAKKLKVAVNLQLDGKLVVAASGNQPIDMGNELEFTVVGPMVEEVKTLQKVHTDWLKKHPKEQRTASVLAEYADKSKTNLSSMVVLAESHGKRILFTGDARGDKILEGLELVKLIDEGGAIHVDVLKGPHHGSSDNVEPAFFERITADHYVFSGNGEHGNPERATLEMLAEARGDDDYQIHLTYPVDEIDVERKKFWDAKRSQELKRREANPGAKVRPAWSKAKHSLAAFLADHPDVNDRIAIVEEGVPHTIDLLG